jgi:hypothetical protein
MQIAEMPFGIHGETRDLLFARQRLAGLKMLPR